MVCPSGSGSFSGDLASAFRGQGLCSGFSSITLLSHIGLFSITHQNPATVDRIAHYITGAFFPARTSHILLQAVNSKYIIYFYIGQLSMHLSKMFFQTNTLPGPGKSMPPVAHLDPATSGQLNLLV